jgi:hypothetical protein
MGTRWYSQVLEGVKKRGKNWQVIGKRRLGRRKRF